MKKIILTIITGLVLFVASLSAAVVVNNKIKNTKYDLIVDNSAGGSVVVDIDGEKTDVPSGEEKTILVKRKTKVKLSATADDKYNFAGWKIGSSNESSDEITLTITSNTEVKTKYESTAVNVTIDGETLSYGIAYNLLEFLQQAFPADAGYTKSYFIDDTKITETTEISADTEITSKQEVITYYVTFMHDNKQVGEKVPYTCENKTVVAPTLESDAAYSYTWPDITSSLNELKNFTVYSEKTPIKYKAIFQYDDTVIAEIEFDLNSKNNVVAPAVSELDIPEGYEATWPEFTLGLENAIIKLNVTPIKYKATFQYGDKVIAEIEFDVKSKDNVVAPAAPAVDAGYKAEWPEFTLDLDDATIELDVTPIEYTVTFKHNNEIVTEETYTVENKNITIPDDPESTETYDYSWPQVTIPNTLGDIVVESSPKAKEFSITYNYNVPTEDTDFTRPNNPEKYTCETETFTLTNPSRSGYKFLGWTENDGTNKKDLVTIEKGSFGKKTYTAHWEEIHTVIKLGDLTASNVAEIYYGTEANEINTKLTTEGFKADPTKTYYFKAIVNASTEDEYYVLDVISITDNKEIRNTYDATTGFKFEDNNNTYTITATAHSVNYTSLKFVHGGITGSDSVVFELWLSDYVTREGDNLKYYKGLSAEECTITISEYLNSIYSVDDGGTQKTITQVIFTKTSNQDEISCSIETLEELIEYFEDYTEEAVTVTFKYTAVSVA